MYPGSKWSNCIVRHIWHLTWWLSARWHRQQLLELLYDYSRSTFYPILSLSSSVISHQSVSKLIFCSTWMMNVCMMYVNVIYIWRPVAKNLIRMRVFRTDPPTDFRSYPLKILLDADIGKVWTQRIRDRADDSDRLPLSSYLIDSCERRSSVSKCHRSGTKNSHF